jgi:hypothetical protein
MQFRKKMGLSFIIRYTNYAEILNKRVVYYAKKKKWKVVLVDVIVTK